MRDQTIDPAVPARPLAALATSKLHFAAFNGECWPVFHDGSLVAAIKRRVRSDGIDVISKCQGSETMTWGAHYVTGHPLLSESERLRAARGLVLKFWYGAPA